MFHHPNQSIVILNPLLTPTLSTIVQSFVCGWILNYYIEKTAYCRSIVA